MVEIALPIASGLVVVLIRAGKLRLHHRVQWLEEVQLNLFADISAGAAIVFGINALSLALLKTELFHMDPSDVTALLAVAGGIFIVQGIQHIAHTIFRHPLGKNSR